VQNKPSLEPILVSLVIFLVACTGTAHAQSVSRTHDIVAEDYFDLITLGNLSLSPDGNLIAFSEGRWGEGKEGRSSDLWTVARDGSNRQRLTFDGFGASGVTFSPDSDLIYFIGRNNTGSENPPYDGSRQVWRITAAGGSVTAMTRADDGVGFFRLSPDGTSLYYTTKNEEVADQWSDLRNKYSDLEYGHGVTKFTAVHQVDLNSWREKEVIPGDRVIWDLEISPDGKFMAMITTEDNELIFKEGWSQVEVLDLDSGEYVAVTDAAWRENHKSPYGWLEDLAWSDDGKSLAFSIGYDGYASDIWVSHNQDDAWSLDLISRPEMITYYGGLKWRGTDHTLCYQGESMGRVLVYAVEDVVKGQQGKTQMLTAGDWVVSAFAFDQKGKKLVAAAGNTTSTDDIYYVKNKNNLKRLTNVNPQVDTWKLPQIEHVSWVGADGDQCYGILELPPGYNKSDGPLPTIIELHGGPTSSTKYRLRLWIYGRALMASKGYALLSPNYHGSTGYGDEFLEKLIGRENEVEVTDIAHGTRWLIEQGIADKDAIGVMGWSNGGYLTNCMIVAEPDMFAAASSGAGVLDMVIQWGTEDTPGHVINFVEGLPWQQKKHYQDASPLYNLDKVKTPTLIHVGGNDPRVPPAHSRALYRALKHYLNVPCELVVYPGEPHGLTTHENRLAKITWDLAWFEKYLLGGNED